MYAVLAEDHSDVAVIKAIINRLHHVENSKKPAIKGKGYAGCSEMLRKGARDLKLLAGQDCSRFIVCYDSDRDKPEARHQKVLDRIVVPAGLPHPVCVLVPVQEIESWILADTEAIRNVIKSWPPQKAIASPENIRDPKEHLIGLSKRHGRPLYSHATHNPIVAQHLNLEIVHAKCPSFRPLAELIRNGVGNT